MKICDENFMSDSAEWSAKNVKMILVDVKADRNKKNW